MEKEICGDCGKIIEGYNKKHVEYLMLQHKLTHREKKLKGDLDPVDNKAGDGSLDQKAEDGE